MTDEYPTIRKQLDAELEQLAQGVEQERERQHLARVRPALYAIQEALAIEEKLACCTKIGEPQGINGLLSAQEDLAEKLVAIEDYASCAVAKRQQTPPLQEVLSAVENEATARLLVTSSPLGPVADGDFTANFNIKVRDDIYNVEAKAESGKISLTLNSRGLSKFKRMRIKINPRKDVIKVRYMEVFHDILNGKEYEYNQLGWLGKSPDKAFRIAARKSKEDSSYVQVFTRMYAALPEIVSEAARGFTEGESARIQEIGSLCRLLEAE